jgi:hypothetical protein
MDHSDNVESIVVINAQITLFNTVQNLDLNIVTAIKYSYPGLTALIIWVILILQLNAITINRDMEWPACDLYFCLSGVDGSPFSGVVTPVPSVSTDQWTND